MNYNYRGKYLPSNDYNKLDVVIFQKTSNNPKQFFMCITSHSRNAPQEPSHNLDTVYWAVLNADSNFPNSIDTFITRRNYSANDIVNVNRYEELFLKPNRTPAEDDEMNSLTNSLRDKIISPDDWNKLQSALQNMQMFLKTEIEGFINQKQAELTASQTNTLNAMENKKNEFSNYVETKKGEFDVTLSKFSFEGNYLGTVQYFKWNTVKYNNETYLCLQDSLGNVPTNTTYWVKIAAKGDPGQQGLAGLGLVYRGTYDGTIAYTSQDAVNYGGSIYFCKKDAPVGINPSDQNYWALFISKQNIPVSPTPPTTPVTGEMWVDSSNNNPVMKYWTGTGWLGTNSVDSEKLGGKLSSYYASSQSVLDALNKIGTLTELPTIDKSSLVKALIEINTKLLNHIGLGGSTHALATTTTAGFMSGPDKDKLNGIQTGAINKTTADGLYQILGTANTDINQVKALTLETDTRSVVITYTGDTITKVEEKSGSTTVKSSVISYNSDGTLNTVTEKAGVRTVTKTLSYSGGKLSGVTKAVT